SPTAELFPPVEGALPVYLSKKFKSVFHARARVAARSLGLLGSLRGSAAGETVAIQRARRAAEIIKKQMAGRMELGRLIDGEPTSWEGAIYEGRIDGRPAAIKISFPIPIGSNRREDVETEATLSREEMASRLIRTDQRHLIHALGSGSVTTNSEKIIWLALELLKGQTLRDYIYHRDMPEKEEEFVLIARCFIQILRALEEFHKLGLIHRDIKPENIWLKSMCETLVHAVLMDFGLTVTRNTVLSQTNDFVGTANYMPPEYIYHDDSENPLSAQGDIWSTGVALFEALTGTLAFSGITPEQIFTRIIRGNSRITQINRHVPPALDAITARMMAPEPEERYQTAGEAASALELWLPKTVTASSLGIQAGKARPRSEQNLVENILLSVRMRSAEHQTAGRMA
ncbi:MAG: serine/threonine protein kinase, partial [Candidatus Omnitrophica bacterium]|nr:serine/threonine protein kinase [Candidatus Omnitrophota bacterium]